MAEPVLQWVDGPALRERVPPSRARRALEQALRGGLDPAADPARVAVPVAHGHLLLMPSSSADSVGVKVASVAPDNPAAGRPRIQALYVLMEAETLTPRAVLHGAELTALRTPAVSAVAADHLAPPDADHLVVLGSGPQAWGHVEALREVRPLTRVTVVGRDPGRADRLRDRVLASGLGCRTGTPDDVAGAPLVVCATSAAEPVLDGALVDDGACVVAIGSHEPTRRELDAALMGRSLVVVEDVATAMREAGDVVLAVEDGDLDAAALLPLRDLVGGAVTRATDRPNVFKGTGMAWEDLVVASVACGA